MEIFIKIIAEDPTGQSAEVSYTLTIQNSAPLLSPYDVVPDQLLYLG